VRGLEGDHEDLEAERFDLGSMLSQLRQVLAAGQSAQVPMEDKKQPLARIVFESVQSAGSVL